MHVGLLLLLWAAGPAAAQGRPRFVNPPAMPTPRGYSHLVEVPPGQRLVYLSGQVALDSTGALVGGRDFRAQARQVFENLRAGLAAVGAGFADVVKLNFYVLDAAQVPVLREVRDQYINKAAPPASTLVEVRRLFREDILLEIEAVAAVRQPGGPSVEYFPIPGERALPFAEAVRVGDMLYLSGQLGTDSTGKLVPGGLGRRRGKRSPTSRRCWPGTVRLWIRSSSAR